ncbi:hypothetical protein ACWGSK_27390 [Nocardiopsis sp. NPDC055551]
MNLRKRAAVTPDVVATLQERTRQAQALASVPNQTLLSDPRLNPDTRSDADRLQAERLATGLEMEHRRELRKVRETDRREEERIRAAAAVDAARAATDPAYTVLDLVRSRTRFSRLCLGASIVLSIGSAMSLEAALVTHYPAAADGVGYIAEITLTGMSTVAILWAGKLARAGRLPDTGLVRNLLVGLMIVPLLISMVGATIGSGPVGAITSAGSAAFAVMAYLVAVTSSAAITKLVGDIDRTTVTEMPVDNEDQELPPLPRRADRDRDALEIVGEEIADQAADFLRHQDHGGDHGGDDTSSPGGDHGPTGDIHPSTDAPPALEDAARRRSQTARQRVEDYYKTHPTAPVKAAAKDLGVDPKTVRKYRPGSDARG